jgi:hypothetical protein
MKLSLLRIVGASAGIAGVVMGFAFCSTTQVDEQQKKKQEEIQREQKARESDMGGHQIQRW